MEDPAYPHAVDTPFKPPSSSLSGRILRLDRAPLVLADRQIADLGLSRVDIWIAVHGARSESP